MRGLSAALACLLALTNVSVLEAQATRPQEYQVKAAYLFNFGRFVTPLGKAADPSGPFRICVIGRDPFGPELDRALSGGAVNGKPVASQHISMPLEALDCKILFISTSEAHRLSEILAVLQKAAVLTVSDIPRFAQRGGMIGFIFDGNRVRFEVDSVRAEQSGLVIGSELLRVASAVRGR